MSIKDILSKMVEETKHKPIDLGELFNSLWAERMLYVKVLPAILVGTYLIMCTIPRTYKSSVILAPESSGGAMSNSLGALASSFGLGSLAKMGGDNDAISTEIYPDLLASNDFLIKLMPVNIITKDGQIKCDYYTYLHDHQSAAPWNILKAKISELISPTSDNAGIKTTDIDISNLTEMQSIIFDCAADNITCDIDRKTQVINITVKAQDPCVAATMANATCQKLQEFIIAYRTNKARIDYEYYKKICKETKEEYDRARQSYGKFSDANEDVYLSSYKLKSNDLENEMQLKYNMYSAMTTQMQMAQAKLQEATPAFTILQSASIPIRASSPKRVIISIIITFLGAIILSIRIAYRKKQLQGLK